MGECAVACAKYSVFFINLVFALTGIAILTVGAFVYTAFHHYENFLGETLWSAPVALMVIGSIIFIIAFLGCCGAVKESPCMILLFSVFLVLIFLVEIGIGVSAYVKRTDLKEILDKGFNETQIHYDTNKEAWDFVQDQLHCCGVIKPEDWKIVAQFSNGSLPNSCCFAYPIGNQNNCTINLEDKYRYTEGCEPKLLSYMESNVLYLGIFGIVIGVLQILGFIYACCLHQSFRKNYEAI